MKYFLYLILVIFTLFVDYGVLQPLGLGAAIPSLFLLIVVCISLEYGSLDYAWFALLGGLGLDIYFALPVGSFAGAYLLIGLVAYLSYGRLLAESGWKYYLAFILLAEAFMLIWLWGYTNILFRLHISVFALSGGQILHQSWRLFLGLLISAFPVYGLVNIAVRLGRKLLRRPVL